ncbi:TonB family protein [Rhodoligotrophos defluvii]|uniref:TonB family protein n=1 Tax=Rhodoligotrophos defluvii TaxID=2561934 RepID=UPI0014859803|nr:energy transducer TonB [Rhodoligotrophos defluvii]
MKRVPSRWILGFMGALAMHVVVLGMVPWPREEALSERSAGEEADVWGAPTSTVMIELAAVESIAGDAPEAAEAEAEVVDEATTVETEPVETETVENEPVETEPVEPSAEPEEVAALEPEPVSQAETIEHSTAKPTEVAVADAEEIEAKPVDQPPTTEPAGRVVAAVDPLSPLEPVEDVQETIEASAPVPKPKSKPVVEKPAAEPKKAEPERKVTEKAAPERKRDRKEATKASPRATRQKTARSRSKGPAKADAGNARVSASAASGIARGNRGIRQAEAGWSSRSNYAGRIVAHLQRHKHYPEAAARNGTTGVATLTFSIASNGRLTSVRLRGSSGAAILDQAALDTVRRASPFPPIPPEAGVSAMTFTVPLRYKRQ